MGQIKKNPISFFHFVVVFVLHWSMAVQRRKSWLILSQDMKWVKRRKSGFVFQFIIYFICFEPWHLGAVNLDSYWVRTLNGSNKKKSLFLFKFNFFFFFFFCIEPWQYRDVNRDSYWVRTVNGSNQKKISN